MSPKSIPVFVLVLLALLAGTAPARAEQRWSTCTPSQVLTFRERVHVLCVEHLHEQIQYLAVPTNDPAYAERVLTILLAAQVNNRRLTVLWDKKDLSGEAYGCGVEDCRPLLAVGFE